MSDPLPAGDIAYWKLRKKQPLIIIVMIERILFKKSEFRTVK